jgi:hypothetical protein
MYGLFGDAVSSLSKTMQRRIVGILMKNEMERVWEEAVVT